MATVYARLISMHLFTFDKVISIYKDATKAELKRWGWIRTETLSLQLRHDTRRHRLRAVPIFMEAGR